MTTTNIKEGDPVKVSLLRRRPFVAVALRVTEDTVEVADPRNGGIRTVRLDAVRKVRGRKASAAKELRDRRV